MPAKVGAPASTRPTPLPAFRQTLGDGRDFPSSWLVRNTIIPFASAMHQWGRGGKAAESGEGGAGQIAADEGTGRELEAHGIGGFNGAAARRPRKDLEVAISEEYQDVASMGPRREGRGKGSHAYR